MEYKHKAVLLTDLVERTFTDAFKVFQDLLIFHVALQQKID